MNHWAWYALSVCLFIAIPLLLLGLRWLYGAKYFLIDAYRPSLPGAVFISFRRKDYSLALEIADHLRQSGLSVVHYQPMDLIPKSGDAPRAQDGMDPRMDFLSRDPGATARVYMDLFLSTAALVVVDPEGNATESAFVSAEIELAKGFGIKHLILCDKSDINAQLKGLKAARRPKRVNGLSADAANSIADALQRIYCQDDDLYSRNAWHEVLAALSPANRMAVNDGISETFAGCIALFNGLACLAGSGMLMYCAFFLYSRYLVNG
ncbi:MAG TPA: hypothetical protein PKD66_13675 [Azonexus sp.]|nr:hypothetical protein [Azonexus sp.]